MIRAALERLAPFAVEQGLPLEPAALDRLEAFLGLLETWNRRSRLTGDRDIETLVSKHVADSLAVAAEFPDGCRGLDVGSGAGFPGLVVACVRPALDMTLLDSRQSAAAFLEAVAARLGLGNVRVLNRRLEELPCSEAETGEFDLGVSRGVRMEPFLQAMATLLGAGGALVLMLSRKQNVPDSALAEVGFRLERSRVYRLPSGETRCIVRYARR